MDHQDLLIKFIRHVRDQSEEGRDFIPNEYEAAAPSLYSVEFSNREIRELEHLARESREI